MTNNHEEITRRVFKIGSTIITESPEMEELSNEAIRDLLKHSYPEVANATIRERREGDLLVIEYAPVAGRKG